MINNLSDVQRKRAELFAQLAQGKIKKYSLRIEGNAIIFEAFEDVKRTIVKLNGDENEN